MARFSDLPTEIRLLIATHIPKSELFVLKSLNSFFLDCWMDIAWKYVMIDADLPVRSVRLLLRVVEPFVATRVKTFAIYLMVIEPATDIVCKVMSLLLCSLPRLPNITYLIVELRKQRSSYFPPLLQTILSSSLPKRLRTIPIPVPIQPCNLHPPVLTAIPAPLPCHPRRQFATHILPPSHPVVDELLGAWLVNLINSKIQFPSLQTLQLHPPTSKTGMSALLTLIKRTVATLSSLTIPFHYLEDEEINQLLDALTEAEVGVQPTTKERSSKLKVLDISIAHLSVSFLDLLARRLPQLENLTLNILEIIDSDLYPFYDLLIQRRYDQRDIDTSISASDSTRDILHIWMLRHISIRKYGELRDAVRAVAGAVPSVILHY